MIKSFKHKGLERFYKTGNTSGIQAQHKNKLRLILSNLDMAETVTERIWSVTVNANWRVTFRFNGTDAEIVNYEDYH